ncbi:hypothetical protein O7621_22550 [Solwaraspora sp. WMMD937]|uniref:hypothetical protein n=1 Tax=Solwaraspora sp. WMMD937 TaxID=3016090 RepID=UPI002499C69B|nr:hypothetical protein [Solwaraspora sp. WMMD937]WFE20649.1 hypothetical protein O7621_22550 [Solwaraspora sp. WMMD937]
MPAHGPVGDSVHRRADELLAHHRDRLAEMAAAVGAGAWTAYLVARTLPWTRRRRTLDDRPPYHRMLAVNDTALHLDLLAEQGRVATHRMGGVRHVDGGLIGGCMPAGTWRPARSDRAIQVPVRRSPPQ